MSNNILNHGDPETLEKKHALEYLALSPTEKFRVLMNLIEISYEIRKAGMKIPDKFSRNSK